MMSQAKNEMKKRRANHLLQKQNLDDQLLNPAKNLKFKENLLKQEISGSKKMKKVI